MNEDSKSRRDLKPLAIFFSESGPCQVAQSVPMEKQRAAKWVFPVCKTCESEKKVVRRRWSSYLLYNANMAEA